MREIRVSFDRRQYFIFTRGTFSRDILWRREMSSKATDAMENVIVDRRLFGQIMRNFIDVVRFVVSNELVSVPGRPEIRIINRSTVP